MGKWKALRVGCDVCGKDVAAPLMRLHLKTQQEIYRLFVLSRDLVDEDRPPVTYQTTSSIATDKFACPVPGCVGTASMKYGIRRHFRCLHPQDLLDVPGEGRYPKCGCCGMQVNPTATGHQTTKTGKAMHAARLERKAVSDSAVAMDAKFYAYREELERVEVFKYLGRLILFDDDDTQAVRGNLVMN